MKLIKYVLTNRGQTPDFVDGSIISGGQFPRANDLEEPKDWTMIGVGDVDESNLPTNCLGVISTKDELHSYMNEYLVDNVEMGFNVSSSAEIIWNRYTSSLS